MKKFISTLIFALIATISFAQTDSTSIEHARPQLRFGYLSYDSVFHAMPEYAIAKKNLANLKAKYDEEMKRVEDEFNQKYELFLQGQRDFAPSILQKRQAELQELMEKNAAFKEDARKLLKQAEDEAYAPIKLKVQKAVHQIGEKRGLAFILNTDGNAMLYNDVIMGEDITEAVIRVAK